MEYWGLATLTAFGEKLAIEHLARQDIPTYSPQFMDRRIKRGRISWTPASLFQGYLFVGICERFRSISGTKGIARLLTTSDGEVPIRVRTEEIEKIKALEVDGFVLLPSLPKFKTVGKFAYGDMVISTQWPTIIGVYSGQRKADRVKVLYQMLGGEREIYLREGDLTAA